MATDYSKMSEDELAEARIALDEQITALRAEKKAIQEVIDLRLLTAKIPPGYTLSKVGGIESQEAVGNG